MSGPAHDGSAPAGVPEGGAPAGSAEEPAFPDHGPELAALVGAATGPPQLSPVAVNEAMVRHWVEAMDDRDPVYVSDEAARAVGLDGAVAPPAMLQAWVMRGLRATLEVESARAEGRAVGDTPHDRMMALLDDEGMTSVVATNCEQHYDRPLVAGDRLVATSVIEAISDVKRTALGTGRFVTTRTDFVAVPDERVGPDPDPAALLAAGEPVGTMRFRILKYRPAPPAAEGAGAEPGAAEGGAAEGTGATAAGRADTAPPHRPRPAITQDNAFFFEGARQHRLLAQRCTACGELRHPPLPACGACRSFEWEAVELSGRGELFSFVVVHYPQVPAFDYPLPVGLVALEEGTRLVADLEGLAPGEWRIGMPVEVAFVDVDPELSLPVFRPTAGEDAGPAGEDAGPTGGDVGPAGGGVG